MTKKYCNRWVWVGLLLFVIPILTMRASLVEAKENRDVVDEPVGRSIYEVSFDANGGSGAVPATQSYALNETVTVPSPGDVTKSGYHFGGWLAKFTPATNDHFTIEGLVEPVVFDDHGLGEAFLQQFAITVELRTDFWTPAKEALTTTVKSNAEVGRFTIQDVPKGDYILYISRPGYLLRTMQVSVTEGGPASITIKPPVGDTFRLLGGDINGDGVIDSLDGAMLQAHFGVKWGDVSYDAAYDLNGDGVIDAKDYDLFLSHLGEKAEDYPGMYIPGIKALNRHQSHESAVSPRTESIVHEQIYQPGDTFLMPNGPVTFVAVWNKVVVPTETYTLSFDVNGGDVDSQPSDQVVKAGELAKAPAMPTRVGYTFTGWDTAQDGTGDTWDFSKTKMPSYDVTLYAQWKKNITIDGDDDDDDDTGNGPGSGNGNGSGNENEDRTNKPDSEIGKQSPTTPSTGEPNALGVFITLFMLSLGIVWMSSRRNKSFLGDGK